MKIEQLQQLLIIVKKGSMNEAAKELFLSRSALSASMKNLEEELGGVILYRHSKGVSLTPFGANVYLQAHEICCRVHFLQSVSEISSPNKLAIASMYCSMGNDAFADFLKIHYKDEFSASIEEMPLTNVIQAVSDGLCEIGIVTLFFDNESITLHRLEEKNLEYHELAQRQLGAIVGSKNPLFNMEPDFVELADLADYPHLENYATPTDHSWEHKIISKDGYRSNYVMGDLGLALRLVEETDAIMVDAYDKEVYNNLYSHSGYKFIPILDYPKCRTGWIKVKHMSLSPLAEEYLSILAEKAEKAI